MEIPRLKNNSPSWFNNDGLREAQSWDKIPIPSRKRHPPLNRVESPERNEGAKAIRNPASIAPRIQIPVFACRFVPACWQNGLFQPELA